MGNTEDQRCILTKRPETLVNTLQHFVYTEGVRSSSLLPPKAFQGSGKINMLLACYSRQKFSDNNSNTEIPGVMLLVLSGDLLAGKENANGLTLGAAASRYDDRVLTVSKTSSAISLFSEVSPYGEICRIDI